MSHQICPPCAEAADLHAYLEVPAWHDPEICRDHAIQPHGCACAHGQTHQTREDHPA